MVNRYRGRLGPVLQQQATAAIHNANSNFQNTSAIRGREADMVRASSGLFVFRITDMDYLKRFLITGTTGNFYVSANTQFTQHIAFLDRIAQLAPEEAFKAIELIEQISEQGRATKNDSALFSLSMMTTSPHVEVRQRAFATIPKVARTSTHLFMLMGFLKEMRGFGRGLRKAVNGWYLNREPGSLGYQLAKYRSREGWTHRDVLRMVRPKASAMSPEQRKLIDYAAHPDSVSAIGEASALSPIISAYEEMKRLPDDVHGMSRGLDLIEEHNLPHELVPNNWKKTPAMWGSMLPSMNPEALMRNLGRMTSLGLFNIVHSAGLRNIELARGILSAERMRRARLHPLKLYVALKAYTKGTSMGGLTWVPSKHILNLLNTAFYDSFAYAPKTGKNIYIGMDVSGSMQSSMCMSSSGQRGVGRITPYSGDISCIEGSAIMARAVSSVESNFHVGAFASTMVDATEIFKRPKDTIQKTAEAALDIEWGSTDLSLPITDAMTNTKFRGHSGFDAFLLFTDNEVNHSRTHPAKLLADYRGMVNKPVKFIVVGMTASNISIADPKDPYMMDIGGFDASIPKLVSEFIAD